MQRLLCGSLKIVHPAYDAMIEHVGHFRGEIVQFMCRNIKATRLEIHQSGESLLHSVLSF
jgi:hypothetical protein